MTGRLVLYEPMWNEGALGYGITEESPNQRAIKVETLTSTQMKFRQIVPWDEQPTLRLEPPLKSLDQHHVVFATPPIQERAILHVENEPADARSSFEISSRTDGSSRGGVGKGATQGMCDGNEEGCRE